MACRVVDVYFAIGHGRRPNGSFDPGAVNPDDGIREYDLNRIVAHYATVSLRRAGLAVISEADEAAETDLNYVGSAARANQSAATVAVEVHHDWYRGVDKLWPLYASPAGQRFGERINGGANLLGVAHRPPTGRDNLYFLNRTTMPAVLVECGRTEQTGWADLERDGEAIAIGVIEHLNAEHGGTWQWVPKSSGGKLAPVPSDPPRNRVDQVFRVAPAYEVQGGWYSVAERPTGGGWIAFPSGAVHAFGGAPYKGGWLDDELVDHVRGRTFHGILPAEGHPTYDYWLVAESGEEYGR